MRKQKKFELAWHPFPEEKPTDKYAYALYLVSIADADVGEFTCTAGYGDGRFWLDDDEEEMIYEMSDVIAWAELPEPYEEE